MSPRITTTTKDVGLLRQLHVDAQLRLSPEYQRNAVWPRQAKAYLIDTILTGNPIPVIYLQRSIGANSGRVEFTVVDGQQRLSALFDFLDDRISLSESSPESSWYRRRWSELDEVDKHAILSYDFIVQEISGYSTKQVRDMFTRMNKYVVALNPQEMRHATEDGEFKKAAERIGAWSYWTDSRIVTPTAAKRMKSDEFAAELLILLSEGPQDKKQSVNFYYRAYSEEFPAEHELTEQLDRYIRLISSALPNLTGSFIRRSANFYALIGALNEIESEELPLPSPEALRDRLTRFNSHLASDVDTDVRAAAYRAAQARQTDNIRPRRTRIDILRNILTGI